MLNGTCLSCKKNLQINISDETKAKEVTASHQLSPRAIPILLLLTRDLGLDTNLAKKNATFTALQLISLKHLSFSNSVLRNRTCTWISLQY